MDLNDTHLTKIDRPLLEKLTQAKRGEVLRVAMTLEAGPTASAQGAPPALDPAQFADRTAYRQALIDQQQTRLAAALGDTIQTLQDLSLKTYGGTTSRVIVAEGTAEQILKSLELPGVNHASFDQTTKVQPPPDELTRATEALIAIAVPQIATIAGLILANVVGNRKTEPATRDGSANQQKFVKAFKDYVATYQANYGTLKPLGMRQEIALDEIYTAVRFLDGNALRQFGSVTEMETAFRDARHRRLRQQDSKTQAGIAVANATQFLMVLGAPGAGKSTFLRKMGLEALKGNRGSYEHRCIPVFLELKQLVDPKVNLAQRLVSAFETCGFPNAQAFTREAVEQGKLLILLDGLDEVPSDNLNRVIQAIQRFVDRYPKNRYIASCRIAAYRSKFERFTDVGMAEFDDAQIQQFIRNWFRSPEDQRANTAEKCWELLQEPNRKGAKELAHTPLLLTFLCLSYDRSLTFPNNRAVLYQKALRILLEEWAAEKRLDNQRKIYEGLSVDLEELLLAEIAATAFFEDRLFFSQKELVEQIKTFLANNLNAPKLLDGEAVLNAIVVQQGILVERAEDVYSFSHLTLQEYLTAQYVEKNPSRLPQVVSRYLTDESWREVFLLIAGLMTGEQGADSLLLLMEEQARSLINTPKLKALLHWADQATAGSEGAHKGVAKRSAAIFLALDRALDLALESSLDLVRSRSRDIDLVRSIVRSLDLVRSLTLACSRDIDLACSINLIRSPSRSLARDRDLARDLALALAFEKIKIFNSVNFTVLVAALEALRSQAPSTSKPYEIRRTFAERISQLWFDTLGLDSTVAQLSEDEVEALNRYLYANELIVRCKESAVRVSPQVWEAIEDRVLRLPD